MWFGVPISSAVLAPGAAGRARWYSVELGHLGRLVAALRGASQTLVHHTQCVAGLNLPICNENAIDIGRDLAGETPLSIQYLGLSRFDVDARHVLLTQDAPGNRELLAEPDGGAVSAVIVEPTSLAAPTLIRGFGREPAWSKRARAISTA